MIKLINFTSARGWLIIIKCKGSIEAKVVVGVGVLRKWRRWPWVEEEVHYCQDGRSPSCELPVCNCELWPQQQRQAGAARRIKGESGWAILPLSAPLLDEKQHSHVLPIVNVLLLIPTSKKKQEHLLIHSQNKGKAANWPLQLLKSRKLSTERPLWLHRCRPYAYFVVILRCPHSCHRPPPTASPPPSLPLLSHVFPPTRKSWNKIVSALRELASPPSFSTWTIRLSKQGRLTP